MDIAGPFVFQQIIPVNIQKKLKADQLEKGKREGGVSGGTDECGER